MGQDSAEYAAANALVRGNFGQRSLPYNSIDADGGRPYTRDMPSGQRRAYGKGELHFITSFCYRRQPKLAETRHRELLLQLLDYIAGKFRFEVRGVAFEDDRFYLLMTEPAGDTADHAVEMLRHRYGRRYNTSARTDEQVWESGWTDQHIVGEEATAAKLRFLEQVQAKAEAAREDG